MKFGMDIMPLEITRLLYFIIFFHLYYRHGGRRNLWGGSGIRGT